MHTNKQTDFLPRVVVQRRATLRRDRDELILGISDQISAIQRRAPYAIECVLDLRRSIKRAKANLLTFQGLIAAKVPTLLEGTHLCGEAPGVGADGQAIPSSERRLCRAQAE